MDTERLRKHRASEYRKRRMRDDPQYRARQHASISRCISESRLNDKIAAINVYTDGEGTCRWCGQGDIDVLTLDHTNNNGKEHRTIMRRSPRSYSIYRWMQNNDYPDGFQVLCMNCNMKKEVMRRRDKREARYAELIRIGNA